MNSAKASSQTDSGIFVAVLPAIIRMMYSPASMQMSITMWRFRLKE